MKLKNTEVIVLKDDITNLEFEAIVNPANNQIIMGGGLARIIKDKAGETVEAEGRRKAPLTVGDAIITSGGRLKAKHVIHSVTMNMDFITSAEIIRKATYNTLLCAQKNNITSLAIPALGCGTGGFSYEEASKIMAQEVFRYVREVKNPTLRKIAFVLYSQDAYDIFKERVVEYLGYMDKKISEGPFLTVDAIIENEEGIVLIERSNPPLGWALPGGFVDYGESVEAAVVREAKEETNLDFLDIKQFAVYSKPDRDPRFHTVSVVFTGKGQGILAADSDAKAAKTFKLDNLPENIAFDHKQIIGDYIKSRKR
ncbi:MAG: macro domain-containing protein [Candidatus Omnitrophica bacterium]|nr:macro domain-containing protein [Candidatus Omnitrophota bacterium]